MPELSKRSPQADTQDVAKFAKCETQEFGEYSFFCCKRRNSPQPELWKGNDDRLRHIIQQDKQVIEYVKKLEICREGNYLARAVEQGELENSGIDDE